MADNVIASVAALTVASKEAAAGVQHQRVLNESLGGGGIPVDVAATSPMPVTSEALQFLLEELLAESRVQTELLLQLANPTATVNEMRAAARAVKVGE